MIFLLKNILQLFPNYIAIFKKCRAYFLHHCTILIKISTELDRVWMLISAVPLILEAQQLAQDGSRLLKKIMLKTMKRYDSRHNIFIVFLNISPCWNFSLNILRELQVLFNVGDNFNFSHVTFKLVDSFETLQS